MSKLEPPPARYFLLRMKDKVGEAKQSKTIFVGWSRVREVDRGTSIAALKGHMAAAYPEWSASARSLGNMAGSFSQFVTRMEIGDRVVVPSSGAFDVVEVASDAYYDSSKENEDTAWRRDVKWLTSRSVERRWASYPLQRRLKAQQTALDISDLAFAIEEAFSRKSPVVLTDEYTEALSAPLVSLILNRVNDETLEQLVANLVRASGAQARVAPKTDRRAGDVDVTATYEFHSGMFFKIGYQVKHHQGTSDDWGIRQLIDRMESDPSLDKGCFVTLAADVNQPAQELAAANDILILKERDLTDWILEVGTKAFDMSEVKTEAP